MSYGASIWTFSLLRPNYLYWMLWVKSTRTKTRQHDRMRTVYIFWGDLLIVVGLLNSPTTISWGSSKITTVAVLAISRLWRDAGFRNCRINFVRHWNPLGACFKVVNVLLCVFFFKTIFVRKYRNMTMYMVCVSAPWFITIQNDVYVHAQIVAWKRSHTSFSHMHFSYWLVFLCWVS